MVSASAVGLVRELELLCDSSFSPSSPTLLLLLLLLLMQRMKWTLEDMRDVGDVGDMMSWSVRGNYDWVGLGLKDHGTERNHATVLEKHREVHVHSQAGKSTQSTRHQEH